MVLMLYGSTLGTFKDQRRSPHVPNLNPMHLGAIGEHICFSNVPNLLP